MSRFQSHVCASHNCMSVQSAYRPHYSTERALLHTTDSVFRLSGQGQPTLMVSLDMSAAFDTIDHSTLFNRLLVGFIILPYYLSYRCPTGLSFGSSPLLVLYIPNSLFYCTVQKWACMISVTILEVCEALRVI